jgi:hypothetical protein
VHAFKKSTDWLNDATVQVDDVEEAAARCSDEGCSGMLLCSGPEFASSDQRVDVAYHLRV